MALSRKEVLQGVQVCGGKATDSDINAIAAFKEMLSITAEGQEFGLSREVARRYAAIEVYGDENAAGSPGQKDVID